jgi:hypothetical protein
VAAHRITPVSDGSMFPVSRKPQHCDGAPEPAGERSRNRAVELICSFRVARHRRGELVGTDREEIDALERRHRPTE